MESITSPLLLYIGSFLVLIANVIWYRTKIILKNKGYNVGWMSRHLDDYPNLLKAIEAETDETEKRKLTFQKNLMLLIWLIFPLGAILIFSGAK